MTLATDKELVDLQETIYSSKNPTRRWIHNARKNWIMNALHQTISAIPEASVLEVGPGSGCYLPTLSKLSKKAMASDIQRAYLNNAQHLLPQHDNLSLTVDDITTPKLEAAQFDVILCTEVIEHIPDSTAALKGMHKLLKPGGILILSTPQKYSPLEMAAKIAFLPGIIDIVRWIYKEPIIETGHINLLTESQLRKQINQANFSILEKAKTGVYIPVLAEFTGHTGLKIEKWLETTINNTAFDWALWTQYFILEKTK